MKNSIILGVGGASLGIILSIFVSYVIVKVRTTASGLLESLSFLSFSFPGIVIGIGFMWFFRADALICHHLVPVDRLHRHLPALWDQTPVQRLHPDPQSSGRVLAGVRGRYALHPATHRDPLLIPGVVSGWILMATMFVRELTLSVVLSRPGTEVLAVQIFRFAEDGLWGKLSALGIMMILVSTALVMTATFVGRKFTKVDISG